MRAYQAKTSEARYGDQVLLHEVAFLQGVCKNMNNRKKWRYAKKVKKLESKRSIVAGGGEEKLKIVRDKNDKIVRDMCIKSIK